MAPYSLPAQCDVRSKLIASCALFFLCDLVRGCFYQRYILQFVSLAFCGLRLSFCGLCLRLHLLVVLCLNAFASSCVGTV
ncbi:hypothetical protein V1519DRAFT_449867, partial [Lipomyces tetrasporus]